MTALANRPHAYWNKSFDSVAREMDQFLDRFFSDRYQGYSNGHNEEGAWQSAVDLWEDADGFHLELEMPGVTKDELEITVHNGALLLAAGRAAPEGDRKYWHRQRRYGRMERVISLPDVVDAENIDAQLRDGVLHVTLTKRPEAQPKKVEIKTS